jgi:hypothetical protein
MAESITHLDAGGQQAVEKDGVIEFRKKSSAQFLFAALVLAIAACLYWFANNYPTAENAAMALATSKLFCTGGVFVIVVAIIQLIQPELRNIARIDLREQILYKGKRQISFGQLRGFSVVPFGTTMVRLSALTVGDEAIALWADVQSRFDALQVLAARLNSKLTHAAVAQTLSSDVRQANQNDYDRIRARLFILTGTVMFVAALVFYRDFYIRSFFNPNRRSPLWEVGAVGIAVGIYKVWSAGRRSKRR